MDKLKPCPFCGKTPEIKEREHVKGVDKWVECECGVTAEVEQWNRRENKMGNKRIHILKIEEPYIQAKLAGDKLFEIRLNDRGYQKGDTVIYRIWDNIEMEMNEYFFEITYVSNYMQKDNYVVFGERKLEPLDDCPASECDDSKCECTEEKKVTDFIDKMLNGSKSSESLEEKMIKVVRERHYGGDDSLAEDLAQIAKAHYKSHPEEIDDTYAREYQDGFEAGQVGMVSKDEVLRVARRFALKPNDCELIKALSNLRSE